ncbi:hypothetical protein NDK43_06885 [Neobacillus pocheonensis]|uniref:Uncharacterized protein n=1 Tax=Neobacillus pocheonensis TaxID=363869 RepID=A0ABT0W774_9BACI|nr:hypothetical protein [Neobacillus pocheonensis]
MTEQMPQATSIINQVRHNSKAQIEARQQAESQVVTNATKPLPNAIVKSNKAMKKLFKQLIALNDPFTEADGISLNTLTYNLHLKAQNEQKLLEFDIEDEQYERFLVRLEKIDKKINESMKQLCLPLTNRLSLANDMAKVMIEEKETRADDERTTTSSKPIK